MRQLRRMAMLMLTNPATSSTLPATPKATAKVATPATVNRNATSDDAATLRGLYVEAEETHKAIQSGFRDYLKALATNPAAKVPASIGSNLKAMSDIRNRLAALPVGVRAKGATLQSVIGGCFGATSKSDFRKVNKSAFDA